ncbi:MAG: hypothetical protein KFF49_10260 [Bacteroidales bacterium]|nr:hypothetical protein [Bacteroidales bacterium]
MKRRKVFRVLTIYAATAFIIIELVNNLIEPLFLPGWTATLILILLIAGLPLVVILSWIYDVTPEGIIRTESKVPGRTIKAGPSVVKRKLRASDIVIAVLLLTAMALFWPKIFSRDKPANHITAHQTMITAVLPFQNMTGDVSLNKWQTAIQNIITTSLSDIIELQVKPTESVNKLVKSKLENEFILASPSQATMIAHKLRAEMYVYGSIKKSGTQVRLSTQLCRTKSGEDIRSFHIDGTKDNMLYLSDTLSDKVKNFLMIYQMQKEVPSAFRDHLIINSYVEYSFFAYGYRSLLNFDYQTATERFSRLVEADSSLVFVRVLLSLACARQQRYDEAKRWCLSIYKKRDDVSPELEIWIDYVYALLFETPLEVIRTLKQLEDFDNMRPEHYYYKGIAYNSIHQHDRAITELEKAVSLYNDQQTIQSWSPAYSALGLAYHKSGREKKEKKLYKKAVKAFPGDLMLRRRQAILALSEGDMRKADNYINKYRSLCSENLKSESETIAGLAGIWSSAGIPDEAEKYYRIALSMDPSDPEIMNSLASLLIENELDISQGMELIDSTLATSPGNYLYLHTKGRGLFKLGLYKEALELLEKSWELKPVYDHELYLHLEEARKEYKKRMNK